MPTPGADESREDFVERCIPIVLEDGTAKDSDQAVAICNSMWEEREEKGHRMDNALKTVSRSDTELRVGNYIVLFGGRDLEGIASDRKNADGSIGEYYTPETNLESRFTRIGRLPVDWEHRFAPEGEDPGTLGYVDWQTAKAMDAGMWVERVLDRRNQYVTWLEELIDAGLIGTSSEADPESVQKADDGWIKRWPLMGDTLTVTPMEPRMLTANALAAAKALRLIAEDEDNEPEPEATSEGRGTVGEAEKAVDKGAKDVDATGERERAVAQAKRIEIDLILEDD